MNTSIVSQLSNKKHYDLLGSPHQLRQLADLIEHSQHHNGLPATPATIVILEIHGYLVDLETGTISREDGSPSAIHHIDAVEHYTPDSLTRHLLNIEVADGF